jgi:hypothetical protein
VFESKARLDQCQYEEYEVEDSADHSVVNEKYSNGVDNGNNEKDPRKNT